MSYVNGNYKRSTSLSRWADIYLAAYNLVQGCLNFHSQGGAATVTSKSSTTHLKFFLESFPDSDPEAQVPGANLYLPCSFGGMALASIS